MPVVSLYCIEWTEYERGWGQRPDGKSYYDTEEAAMKAYNKAFEGRTNSVPDDYTNPSKPFLVEAREDILREVHEKGIAWRR